MPFSAHPLDFIGIRKAALFSKPTFALLANLRKQKQHLICLRALFPFSSVTFLVIF